MQILLLSDSSGQLLLQAFPCWQPLHLAVDNLTTEHRVASESDPHMVLLTIRLSGTLLPRVIMDLVTNKIVICPATPGHMDTCTQHSTVLLPLYCCVVQRSESTENVILMQRQNQQN